MSIISLVQIQSAKYRGGTVCHHLQRWRRGLQNPQASICNLTQDPSTTNFRDYWTYLEINYLDASRRTFGRASLTATSSNTKRKPHGISLLKKTLVFTSASVNFNRENGHSRIQKSILGGFGRVVTNCFKHSLSHWKPSRLLGCAEKSSITNIYESLHHSSGSKWFTFGCVCNANLRSHSFRRELAFWWKPMSIPCFHQLVCNLRFPSNDEPDSHQQILSNLPIKL